MRVLIVLGGDLPGNELLARCVRETEMTIAADRGLEAFEEAGLVPDLLLGDMDSVSAGTLERLAGKTQIERLPVQKDDTDGVHALDVAIKKGAAEITLLGALGGRLDHAMANLMMLVRAYKCGVNAEILSESVRIVHVGRHTRLCGAKGDTVSLLPMGEAVGVTLRGFFYPLCGHTLTNDYPLGLSNVVTEDEAEVFVQGGDLLLFHFYRNTDEA